MIGDMIVMSDHHNGTSKNQIQLDSMNYRNVMPIGVWDRNDDAHIHTGRLSLKTELTYEPTP